MNRVLSIEDVHSIDDVVTALKSRTICIVYKASSDHEKKEFEQLMRLMDETDIMWYSGDIPSGYIPQRSVYVSTKDRKWLYCYHNPWASHTYTAKELLEACESRLFSASFNDLDSILSLQ